jgi:hypothetical protein
MALFRVAQILLFAAILALGGILFYGYARNHPQNLPWTALDLGQPVGVFTGRKLTALRPVQCHALLSAAGVRFVALPPRTSDRQCGYRDAVRLSTAGSATIAYRPANLGTSCSVAASLAMWEWDVVQPAALGHFGSKVAVIDHYGSYNCRRIYGRAEGGWSEHASANAIDVAGFRLANGRRMSVARDWNSGGDRAAFLREVRDGACDLFATVLSPDYNRAHHDHLHLDQAARGAVGWRACR